MSLPTIAFSWRGIPHYAARCISTTSVMLGVETPVISTQPTVPIKDLGQICGRDVVRIDARVPCSWSRLGLPVPEVFFQAGWGRPGFETLGQEVIESGGRVIVLFDNAWGWRRKDLGAVVRGTAARRRGIWGAFVPGQRARSLALKMGFPEQRIFTGLYGADPKVFYDGDDLSSRPKRITFVGRFISRKNCIPLTQAFTEFRRDFPEWELDLYGAGPQEEEIQGYPGVNVHPFSSPDVIAASFRKSRILALPSKEDNWGLVVHEAALSGCQLLLSRGVGAADDLATPANSLVVRSPTARNLAKGLQTLAGQSSPDLARARTESLLLSERFGPDAFARTVQEIATLP